MEEYNQQQENEQVTRRRPPIRYDENGNPIPPRKRPPIRYDENGNPIPPRKRPPIRYDENGNPIPPQKRPPVRYDANGNPIPPSSRPRVRYDANGNPIPPSSRPPMPPMQGRPVYPEGEEEAVSRKDKATKKKRNWFGKLLIFLQAAVTVLFMILVFVLNLLPFQYEVAIGAILLVLWVFTLISQKFRGSRIVGKIYAILLIGILSVGTAYIWKTNSMIADLTTGQLYKAHDISIVVLQDSPVTSLEELDGCCFGIQSILDRSNTDNTLSKMESRFTYGISTLEYAGYAAQVQGLYDGQVNAIIMNEMYRDLIKDSFPDFDTETRVIESFSYKEEIANIGAMKSDVDVTEEPFTVFISGNDSYGEVSLANGRTDVNILATVNPKTKQILLTTTPRDYYVELSLGEGCMDKLTHAGLYGIDCSMETLENPYDIEIDYYVRINFSGFSDIVNALGGVDVYSDYSFTAVDGSYFYEGYNYVDGDSALAFVRERQAFSDGDVQRGRNQMAMIQAIIDKATSPAILTGYMDLMDSISGSFITDMSKNDIADLVKMQLSDGASWNIVSNSVTGYDNSRTTYSVSDQYLYVMDPDEAQVEAAKELMQRCRDGEILTP